MKKGEIHFHEELYFWYHVIPLIYFIETFLLMKKRGRSNGRLLTWEKMFIVLAILFILMLYVLLFIIACIIFNNNVFPIAKLLFMLFMFDYIILSILNILLEVSKLEYFLNSKEYILRGSFLITLVLSSSKRRRLWNQGLVNLDFDDNKTRFKTNDYISSVIRQDDFQSDNHKEKSSQREIMKKKKKTSKRSVFQDPSFIRSLVRLLVH